MCENKTTKRCAAIKHRLFSLTMAAVIFFSGLLMPASFISAAEPRITARSAILYDRVSHEILFEKNSFEKRPPASTTKIMTAIIAIEMGCMSDEVVISKYAASVGGSSIRLREGERFTFEDLLWGTLLKSGNDSSVALAEAVAGSESLFVEMMNKKAFLIGAVNTNFKNTNGLPKKGHLSTSYDLAVITDYALSNDIFSKIVSTKHAVIPKKDTTWRRNLNNTNRLLFSYEGADGVKTGTTNAAGQCLVASATRDGRQLISVVLRSGNRYGDSQKLLNHGFENYCLVNIPQGTAVGNSYFEKGKPYQVELETLKESHYTVHEDKLQSYQKRLVINKPSLPIKKGQEVGYLEIKANKTYKIPVTVAEDVKKETPIGCVKRIIYSIPMD